MSILPKNDVAKFEKRRMETGESFVSWCPGYVGEMMGSSKDAQRNGALIVTDRRVVFYASGIISETLEQIPLDRIASIEYRSTMGHHTVEVHTSGNSLVFKTFDKIHRDTVLGEIEARRALKSGEAPTEPAALPRDPIEAMRKLKAMHDENLITTAEFEDRKKAVLARM